MIVLEGFTAITANVVSFFQMNLFVDVQGTLLLKTFFANSTLKRFWISVDFFVFVKVRIVSKSRGTDVTRELFVCFMMSFVDFQACIRLKRGVAKEAVKLGSFVRFHVALQFVFLGEGCATHFAFYF